MKQWFKISLALKLVREQEKKQSYKYDSILKLRTDYFFSHPKYILKDIIKACSCPNTGLVGASDKVFGGSRDLMMTLTGFSSIMETFFYEIENDYWPINLEQVILSDEALKWYGMNWPVELIGQPESIKKWKERLIEGGENLAKDLSKFKPKPNTKYHQLFKGNPKFASEVSFARFLNFNGIPFRDCYSLRGFLYRDRMTCL